MESNGAPWVLINARQEAQGRRLDTIEQAVRHQAEHAVVVEEKTSDRLGGVERKLDRVETTIRVVFGVGVFVTPFLTVILAKVLG